MIRNCECKLHLLSISAYLGLLLWNTNHEKGQPELLHKHAHCALWVFLRKQETLFVHESKVPQILSAVTPVHSRFFYKFLKCC